MRIDPKITPLPLSPAAVARRGPAGARFEVSGGERAGGSAGPAPVGPLASLDAILALQGEEDPAERRRRSVRRGQDLLDGLDRLKAGILAGRIPLADLEDLRSRLSARAAATGDPRLDEILAHIELRAAVEIAKLKAAGI